MEWLTHLPNEITLKIMAVVSPDDIESFTSTCTKIYNLAAQDLERHRALKRQYAVYWHRHKDDTSSRCTVSQLLDDIFQEPRIAFYVRELWIFCWHTKWATHEDSETPSLEDVHMPYDKGTISMIGEVVSRHVPHKETSAWMRSIESGNEDPIVALLLLLLPNLSTLKLDDQGDDQEYSYGTLWRIAKMKGPHAPLSHLRDVEILFHWCRSENIELKIIRLFAALPSVRSIHTQGPDARDSEVDQDNELPLLIPDSRLQDLALTSCSFNSERLYDFLKLLKALRSFTYEAEGRAYVLSSPRPEFEPSRILSGLSNLARSTLESLTILSHNKKRSFMGDIRSFRSLRNLHIEPQLLLNEFNRRDVDTLLVKALPPKLETLKLECSKLEDERMIARWIHTLAELKPKCVPKLQKVEVTTPDGEKTFNSSHGDPVERCRTYKALVEACKRQSVQLIVGAFTPEEIQILEFGEEKVCVCQRELCGEMKKCSNDECQHGQMFHRTCVVVVSTHTEWYCPGCLADKQESNAENAGGSNV